MTRRAVAWLLVLGLCTLAGCASPAPEPPGPSGSQEPGSSRPTAADGAIVLTAVRPPGLDVVQTGGGDTVDHIIDSIGCGGAWLDHDGDGDADLYLAMGATRDAPADGPPDRLLRNDGDADGDGVPSFTDVTAAAGLGDRSWSFGVSVADYDNDGDPDIYLTNWGENRLYRNDGDGTFTELARAAGVAEPAWSVSSAWSDVDRDGDLDLYVTNYVVFDFARYPARGEEAAGGKPPCNWKGIEVFCGPRNLEPAPDRFFRNEGDPDGDGVPTFVEATAAAGLATEEAFFGLAAHFFDAEGDGDDDLYVANDSVQNTYFENRGDGTFEETAIFAGLAYNEQGTEQAGMGIASADVDGDGRLDLAVTNFSHDHDTLYRNDGDGAFTDVSYVSGLGTASFLTLGWGLGFFDLDQDTREDLYVTHGHVYPQVDGRNLGTAFRQPDGLYRNVGDMRLEDVGAHAGSGLAIVKSSREVLAHDVDADGDLDLLVTQLNEAPDLLRNDGARGGWLRVRLTGRRSNRDGIGARVVVRTALGTQIREVRRDTSYGAVLPVAHFGLGAAETIQRFEVRWPSGAVSVEENLPGNREIEVAE